MSETLTTSALRALIVSLLAGATGSSEEKWREVLSGIEIHAFTDRGALLCNWSPVAKGSPADLKAVRKAVEIVRVEHPFAVED